MEQSIPEWSGEFWQSADGDFGYLAVWIGDERHHKAPGGWRFCRRWYDDVEEADIYVYRKVSCWLSPAFPLVENL